MSHRSFCLSGVVSPWLTWPVLVAEFIDAKEQGIQELQVFYNTHLARTWDDAGSSVEPDALERHRDTYDLLPLEALVLTAGVDIQDDRIEVEVVTWGAGYESWGVEYRVFVGDPAVDADVWNQLNTFLRSSWQRADGITLRLSCTCVDSGGHCTSQVYRYCRRTESRRIFAIKGRGGNGVPMVGKPTRTGRERTMLFTLGVDALKTLLFSRLVVNDFGPDFCHWPRDEKTGYDHSYFVGLVSEQRVVTSGKSGRKVEWRKKNSKGRNEPLDCRVYATAALLIFNPNLTELSENKEKPATPKRRTRVLSSGIQL